MAKRNFVVSRSIHLRGAGPEGRMVEVGGLSVELDEGRNVRLDPQNPRSEGFARVLAGLSELKRPVYIELDPETEAVSRLLIPAVGQVSDIQEVADGLEIQIDRSHGRFLLRRDQDDFAEMESTLRQARSSNKLVMLTSDDAQEVADIRFFRPGPDDGPAPDFPLGPKTELGWMDRIRLWPCWPWRWSWYRCLSAVRAQQIFDAMSATTCNPNAIAAPCIPFMFPDDGCWARAHEMRRLMNAMGIEPKKLWIQGSLHTLTRNNPNCYVNWGWHVAPTICVRRRWRPWYLFWWWHGERMVIDPALFTTPVSKTAWKAVQGDANATLTETDGSDYWFGQTDPTYTDTNYYLSIYRLELQNRVNQVGAPPYANCP